MQFFPRGDLGVKIATPFAPSKNTPLQMLHLGSKNVDNRLTAL